MKRLFAVFLLALVACSTSPKKDYLKEPLLFELTKDGKTHYILGTVHIPLDVEKMYPQVYSHIRESTTVVLEIDSKFMESKTLAQLDEGRQYYKDGSRAGLQKDLSPAAYKMTADKLFFISDGAFSTLKPQRALTLLSEKYKNNWPDKEPRKLGEISEFKPSLLLINDGRLYDRQLEDYARSLNKKIVALEEFNNPILEKCAQLDAIVEIEKMAVDEKANTTDQFYQEARQKSDSCSLSERNQAWMAKLKSILDSKEKVFVAVGMAHLSMGSSTLSDLIKAEGYSFKNIGSEK